uniref:RING-type E3 ubiquitin transferase n=2 Tax=Nicotiana TaxID=4085 RepID=A0A1S3WYH7_TOBAC|nr:PREDICTED: RING finger protein 11-like [Nicotiana sylvestris]XP_016432684.1 PREDICTED: RING finger protein 11-like [Nicotiana tabacum]
MSRPNHLPYNNGNPRYVPNAPVNLFYWQPWRRQLHNSQQTTMPVALSVLDDNYSYERVRMSRYLKIRMHYIPVMDIDLDERPDRGADDEEPETCAICILEYKNGDIIGKLQCEHEFHLDCIKQWLLKKKVCPLCRASADTFI